MMTKIDVCVCVCVNRSIVGSVVESVAWIAACIPNVCQYPYKVIHYVVNRAETRPVLVISWTS